MPGPLVGLRVVDCSSGIAGPRLTGLLADYGADVIWVETPGGDPLRRELEVEYSVFNRGKRSVEVDLGTDEGRTALRGLLQHADLLVETWAPGEAASMGLSSADLREFAPRLVHCSISGFGEEGTLSGEPSGELIAQALAGVMGEQVGWREGPIPSAVPLASIGAAYLGAFASLGALCRAREDGIGRHVETSLYDGALSYLTMLWGIADEAPPAAPGAGHKPGTIRLVSSSYLCADDEYLGIHTGAVGAFGRFITALGLQDRIPPVIDGPDMGSPLTAEQSRIVLEEVPEIFRRDTRANWLAKLLAADVCAVPHLRSGQVFDEPQAVHNDMAITLDDPTLGRVKQVGLAVKFGRSVPEVPTPAPLVGSSSTVLHQPWPEREPISVTKANGNPDRGLFAGVNIVDVGGYYAGPYSSRLLGEYGADVIKAEPLAGDQLRGLAKVFRAASANKRSIALDFKRPELAAARDALIDWADVVHHNMRPGAAERIGLGYDDVAKRNPRAIYLYAPGWGSSGPDRDRQSFAPMMSGYVGAGLEVAGRFNPPLFPLGNEDPGNGLLGAVAIAMALYERQTSGLGQYIENPQLNATMLHLAHIVRRSNGDTLGDMRLDPLQYGFGPLQRVFETNDGWVVLDANDNHVGALDAALGLGLATDPRFQSATDRVTNADELDEKISDVIGALSTEEVLHRLRDAKVPAARPLGYNAEAFLRDPENIASGRSGADVDASGSTWRAVGSLVRVSDTARPSYRLAPGLGEHTDGILQSFGIDDASLASLRAEKAIR